MQWLIIMGTRALTEYAPPYHILVIIILAVVILEMRQRMGEASNPGPSAADRLNEASVRERMKKDFARTEEVRTPKESVGYAQGRPVVSRGAVRSGSLSLDPPPWKELRTKVRSIESRKTQGEQEAKRSQKSPEKFNIGSNGGSPETTARTADAEVIRGRQADAAATQLIEQPAEATTGRILGLLDALRSTL